MLADVVHVMLCVCCTGIDSYGSCPWPSARSVKDHLAALPACMISNVDGLARQLKSHLDTWLVARGASKVYRDRSQALEVFTSEIGFAEPAQAREALNRLRIAWMSVFV